MTFVCNLCLLPCSFHFECYVSITQSVTLKKLMAQRHKLRVRRHRNLCDIENASQHTYVLLCAMQLLKLVTDVIKALN